MKSTGPRSALDELSGLAIRLPWWGGLLSALAAYVLLHPIATLQLPAPIGMVDLVTTSLGQLLVFLAQIAQYLLPLAFLISAAVSGFVRWKRSDLRESVVQDTTGSILRGLRWSDFALLVGEAFRRQGYELSESRNAAAGRDTTLALTREDLRYLVDCTDWRSSRAGARAVRELSRRIDTTGAEGGFAVTSGQFTSEAKHFAVDRNIELIDGRHLKELFRSAPKPTPKNPAVLVAALRSLIARGGGMLLSDRGTARRWAPVQEPSIMDDAEGPRRNHPARDTPGGKLLAADDAEVAVGAELAALIRSERRFDEDIKLSAPPVQPPPAKPPRARRPRRPIRPKKIVDAVGVLIALAILWGAYDWFSTLPDAPTDTPWALLGASHDSEALARRMQGIDRPPPGARAKEGERPLGQLQFGPSGLIADLEAKAREKEGYNSLRELETAFDDKYVPPPECYAWESSDQMVKCGNHRIRARRDFIASGGEVTAAMLGSWEEPRPVMTEVRPRDWRQYEQRDWQDSVDREWDPDQDGQETGQQEPRGGWNPDPLPDTGLDASEVRDQEYVLEPNQDWQPGRSGTPRGGWRRPATEEPVRTTRDQVDRQPERGDWRLESEGEWRQRPVEDPPLEPRDDWRQEWLRGPGPEPNRDWQRDWIQPQGQDSEQDTSRDWRQNWREVPRQETGRDWRRDWESEPAPAERRHWVDEL